MKATVTILLTVGLIVACTFLVPRLNFHLRAASNAKLTQLAEQAQNGDLSALKHLATQVKGRNGANAVVALERTANLNSDAVAKYVIPAFVEALTSRDAGTRRQAALSLHGTASSLVRTYPAELIPALSHMATNENPAQVFYAIESIAEAGDHSVDSLIAIARYYQASTFMPGGGFDYRTPKAAAFRALSKLGPSLPAVQTLFRNGLQDVNPYVQLWSAIGLFNSGSRDLAESQITELVNSNDEDFLFIVEPELQDLPGLSPAVQQKLQQKKSRSAWITP